MTNNSIIAEIGMYVFQTTLNEDGTYTSITIGDSDVSKLIVKNFTTFVVVDVPSKSNPGDIHKVYLYSNGTAKCDCMGWKWNLNCRHCNIARETNISTTMPPVPAAENHNRHKVPSMTTLDAVVTTTNSLSSIRDKLARLRQTK